MSSDCECVIHRDVPSNEWDDGDRRVVSDVLEFGWHLAAVGSPDDLLPWWCYTVGLRHSFGAADLVMVGLHPEAMSQWITEVVDRLHEGARIADGDELTGVIAGFPVRLRTVADGWGEPLFGQGRWFSLKPEPPMLQVVWPDPAGRWPWDPAATSGCRVDQAHLWLPPDQHPRNAWTAWADDGID